jgi:hypothetical protein
MNTFPDVQCVGDGIGLVGHAVDQMLAHGFGMDEGLEMVREKMLRRALERTAGNITHAGRVLGQHRNTLARELEKFGLSDLPARIRQRKRREPVQERLEFGGLSLVPAREGFPHNPQLSHSEE